MSTIKVKATLWTHHTRKDGTHKIKIYVNGRGGKFYYATPFCVKPEQWDEQNGIARRHPHAAKINLNLRTKIRHYEDKLYSGASTRDLEKKEASNCVIDFLDQFIKEVESGLHNMRPSSLNNYYSFQTRLAQFSEKKYGKKLTWDDITMTFYNDYYNWITEGKLGKSAFNNHIKVLKKILREAHDRELHTNRIYQKKGFRKLNNKPLGKVYLNETDIQKLEEVDLAAMPHLDYERDRFLLQYYLLMRFQDTTAIKKENLRETNGTFFYVHVKEKTSTPCTVPVNSKAKAIMEKWDFTFDRDTNQEANRKIKSVGQLAGIDELAEDSGRSGPKYHFLTTHTARRSAATNLYIQKADTMAIMRLGGWKSLQTLKRYLLASNLEVAKMTADLAFFE
jgi:site-specific recombinase XerD